MLNGDLVSLYSKKKSNSDLIVNKSEICGTNPYCKSGCLDEIVVNRDKFARQKKSVYGDKCPTRK